jgi:hypothetical protein
MSNTFLNGYNIAKPLAVLCLLLAVTMSTYSQQDRSNLIQQKFSNYSNQSLQEKLFVHIDRNSYIAGDIMWFKIYCLDAANDQLLMLSKVAYIEIVNKDQQPVLQAKIALESGTGSGSLSLPASMKSDNYTFRAYTSWMKNTDPAYYFHQTISVANTIDPQIINTAFSGESLNVQFFPESGYLVDGLVSKVAFKATDILGKGPDINGSVIADNGDTITRFQSLKFGMGNFTFTPAKNKQYKAIITTAAGKTVSVNLPAVTTSGFVMAVKDAGSDKVNVHVSTNTNSRSAVIFMHTRGEVKAAQQLVFSGGQADILLDRSLFGEGISQLTLFNDYNEPVCERLYFKQPVNQQMAISAVADAPAYQPRRKVTISVGSFDDTEARIAANLSLAVIPFETQSNQNIYSYLWLSSDLKGSIENPGYYFSSNSAAVNEAADNLMLTQGWRRFNWASVLNNRKQSLPYLPEYEGHIVSGKVVDRATDRPTANILTYLSLPGTHFKLYPSTSDSSGNVRFSTKDVYGNRLMATVIHADEPSLYRVNLASPFSEHFSADLMPPYNAPSNNRELLKRGINVQVQQVFNEQRLNAFANPIVDTALFYGKADRMYLLDDYTRFPTMEEVLTEYVMEISIRKRKDKFDLTMLKKDEFNLFTTTEPIILLDGVPQFDNGDKMARFDALKIKKLEMVKDTYFLGKARFDAIASFFTYRGDLDGFTFDSTSTVLDYDALQLKRVFYSPAYETADQYNSRLPDFREVLFWSPGIITSKQGKRDVTFYTGDRPGKYTVVVQGISAHGKVGATTATFEVKRDDN